MEEQEIQAVAIIANDPGKQIAEAKNVAGICKEVVLKLAINIQGNKYLPVEAWQSIAIAHGCAASSRSVQKTEDGFIAIGEIRRMSDGLVIAEAEGFVGNDEDSWASKPEYARRAMAQTRAISRACRSAFAHVVMLMDAGLSTTPAEEVPKEGFKSNVAYPLPSKPFGQEADAASVNDYFGDREGYKKTFGVEIFKIGKLYYYAPIGTYDKNKAGEKFTVDGLKAINSSMSIQDAQTFDEEVPF
jgi:hypothetical protein